MAEMRAWARVQGADGASTGFAGARRGGISATARTEAGTYTLQTSPALSLEEYNPTVTVLGGAPRLSRVVSEVDGLYTVVLDAVTGDPTDADFVFALERV